ncbi:unnamed protein product [Cylicocyclus nassatus]|uniref:Uncharacterized protein n=1 Tax=Cylicocyclus nassatus TaxID=53992 RepID=A0AA36M1U1_CYLNA|nr:unnamed protein product [Cylicocyclus nassatus]
MLSGGLFTEATSLSSWACTRHCLTALDTVRNERMMWALTGLLLLFNLGTVISLCEGMDSRDPLVRRLAKERCNSYCEKKDISNFGECKGKNKCICIPHPFA